MSISREVLLARHGAHDELGIRLSGRSEIGLNAAGIGQARALAAMLRDVGVGAIQASPRARTVETAAAVAEATGLAVTAVPALDEIDFGSFAGRRFAALDRDPAWHRWNAERATFRCPGGETMADAIARARDHLLALPAGDRPILCVTHCDVIRGLAADASGHPLDRLWDLPCDPGSVTGFRIADGVLRLTSLNRLPG